MLLVAVAVLFGKALLEYCAPIFHHNLPDYFTKDLECVQKRALAIISHEQSHKQCFDFFGLKTLYDRRNDYCAKCFIGISASSHKLANLLPSRHEGNYNIRRKRAFDMPHFHRNSSSSPLFQWPCILSYILVLCTSLF